MQIRFRRRPGPILRPALLGAISAALLVLLPLGQQARGEDWRSVGPGIDYRLFVLPDPNQVHVARLDTQEPSAIIESSLAVGDLASGFETVSGMARRYDGGLIAWGGAWGPRGRVLIAINGSSLDLETTQPYGGVFHAGEYARRYGNLAGGTGFVWTSDRRGVVRGCIDHDKARQIAIRLSDRSTFEIDALNILRPDDGLLLFTPNYGPTTPESGDETEAVIQVERPIGIVPLPRFAEGVVLEVREGNGQTPIGFDQVVLSAKGATAPRFLRQLEPGERIGISQEITDLDFRCRQPGDFDWTDAYAAIGGGHVFLRDGEIFTSDDSGEDRPEPRTAICVDDRYVFFLVVDGRNPGVSRGMSLDEVAEFCLDELGATYGLNQDGGGSSTMWVDGVVVNSPSDGQERPVANGLMMMIAEPAAHSRRFDFGYDVRVNTAGAIHLGPGPLEPVLGYAEVGEAVKILPSAVGLRGVFAGGSYWWKVFHRGEIGWIAEQALVEGPGAISLFELPDPPRARAEDPGS